MENNQNENERLKELYSFDILDTEPEEEFDELVELAAQICGCPITAINFVDKNRQFTKAKVGGPLPESREYSFCTFTIQNKNELVVPDATKDQRFAGNPYVGEQGIRFYAGVPILSPANQPLGAVCVIDSQPREFGATQLAALKLISKQVTRLLELRLRNKLLQDYTREALQKSELLFNSFFANDGEPKCIFDAATLQLLQVNQAWLEQYGYTREELLQQKITDLLVGNKKDLLKFLVKGKASDKAQPTLSTRQRKKNGKQVAVEIAVTDLVYLGKPARVASVADITEQEQLRLQSLHTEAEMNRVETMARNKEREHIGRELHDNINQILTSSRLYLDMAEVHEDIRIEMIRRSKENINDAINEVRTLSKALVTTSQSGFDFVCSVTELMNTYSATGRFKVHLAQTGDIKKVPDDVKINLFRIIQEQFTNIAKHACARNVHLSVDVSDQVLLYIEDDGKGFDTGSERQGIGLRNIGNRVAFYHGSFWLKSAPGKGTSLNVAMPLAKEAEKAATI